MALRIELRTQAWDTIARARVRPTAPPSRGAAWGAWLSGYWLAAFAAVGLLYADVIPVRGWLDAAATPAPQPIVAPPPAQESVPSAPRIARSLAVIDPAQLQRPAPSAVAALPDAAVAHDADASPAAEPTALASDDARPTTKPSATSVDPRDSDSTVTVEPQPVAAVSPPPAPAPPPPSIVAETPRPALAPAAKPASAVAGQSCQDAIAAYTETLSADAPPDLTAGRYAAVLNRGSYFSHCSVPANVAIDICAAVQNGVAVGVTVTTEPGNASAARCVARAVRGLSFPSHPRMDVVRTHFAAQ